MRTKNACTRYSATTERREYEWIDKVQDSQDATELADVILLRKELFTALVSNSGSSTNMPRPLQGSLHLANFKYLSHVRQIATNGMAEARANADESHV